MRTRPLRGQTKSIAPAPGSVRSFRDLESRAWEKLDSEPAHAEIGAAWRDRPDFALTLRAIDVIDGETAGGDPRGVDRSHAEALEVLARFGNRAVTPLLVARALRADTRAIAMLGALGDARSVPHLVTLLDRPRGRFRHLDAAVVAALRAIGAQTVAPKLVALLIENALGDWREALERAALVRELLLALAQFGDARAQAPLSAIASAESPEYKELAPLAIDALARIGARDALSIVIARARRNDGPLAPEHTWALGALAAKDKAETRAAMDILRAATVSEEVVRAMALAKLGARVDIGAAIATALKTPGYKREDTVRRRTWAMRAYADSTARVPQPKLLYLLTREDARVRGAVMQALAKRSSPVPETRAYFSLTLDDLEASGGLLALERAVRDPRAVFAHNVALRLSKRDEVSASVALVARGRERFAEPAGSTCEYEDPPWEIACWVRALNRSGKPDARRALLEALASDDVAVRAAIAEDPPRTRRAVPLLRRMVADTRVNLRPYAERGIEILTREGVAKDGHVARARRVLAAHDD